MNIDKLFSKIDLGIKLTNLDEVKNPRHEESGLLAARNELIGKIAPLFGGLIVGGAAAAIFSTFTVEARGMDVISPIKDKGRNTLNLDANDPLLTGGDGGPDPRFDGNNNLIVVSASGNPDRNTIIPLDLPNAPELLISNPEGLEYWSSGESGLFLVKQEIAGNEGLGIGNIDSRSGSQNILFDMTLENETRSPHLDEAGNVDGYDIVRAFDKPALKFLMENHGSREGSASSRRLNELFQDSTSQETIIIRQLNGKNAQGNDEIVFQLIGLDEDKNQFVIFEKELHQGVVETPVISGGKLAMLVQNFVDGEAKLIALPSFPESYDATKLIPWQDSKGSWWAGSASGEKTLTIDEKTGEWVKTVELPVAIKGLAGIEVGQDGMYIATLADGTKLSGSAESIYVGSDGIPRMGGVKYNKETKTWELNIVTTLYGENAPKFNQEDIDNGNVDEFFKAIYDAEGWAKVMEGRELPTNLEMKWGPDGINVDADLDGKKDDRIQTFFISNISKTAEQVPFVPGGVFVEVVRENGMVGRVTPVFAKRGGQVLIFKDWFGELEMLNDFAFAEHQVNFTAEHWRSVLQGGSMSLLQEYVSPTIAYSLETDAIGGGTDSLPMFQEGGPETEARMSLMENVNTLQPRDLEGDIFFSAGLRPIAK